MPRLTTKWGWAVGDVGESGGEGVCRLIFPPALHIPDLSTFPTLGKQQQALKH